MLHLTVLVVAMVPSSACLFCRSSEQIDTIHTSGKPDKVMAGRNEIYIYIICSSLWKDKPIVKSSRNPANPVSLRRWRFSAQLGQFQNPCVCDDMRQISCYIATHTVLAVLMNGFLLSCK